jgi:DNA-binding XRE family transcriptional regulator
MKQKEYMAMRIKELRKARPGITQEALGQMLEPPVTRQAVQSWEAGRTTPDGETLLQLCRLLGAGVADFYTGADSVGEQPAPGEAALVSAYRSMSDSARSVLRATATALAEQAAGADGN